MDEFVALVAAENASLPLERRALELLANCAKERLRSIVTIQEPNRQAFAPKPVMSNRAGQVRELRTSTRKLAADTGDNAQMTVTSVLTRVPHIKPKVGAPGEMMMDNIHRKAEPVKKEVPDLDM